MIVYNDVEIIWHKAVMVYFKMHHRICLDRLEARHENPQVTISSH